MADVIRNLSTFFTATGTKRIQAETLRFPKVPLPHIKLNPIHSFTIWIDYPLAHRQTYSEPSLLKPPPPERDLEDDDDTPTNKEQSLSES